MTERKTIFITGAGSGIGRAAAQRFAERGWFVGLYDVNARGLDETEATIPADQRTRGVFDVRDAAAWKEAVAQFGQATGGKMHVLFNNAGIGRHGFFEDVSEADSDLIIDVNLKGVVNGVYAALPLLKATKGRVINTASAASLYGPPQLAIYGATKFAVRGLTEALDIEFSRYGVRAVCLVPWFVETPIIDMPAGGSNEVMRDRIQDAKIYPVSLAADGVWEAAHTDDLIVTVGKEARDL
ncbi:MAG: SDR family oxidoreductase, partial [Hyphomonadaceae bacterium]